MTLKEEAAIAAMAALIPDWCKDGACAREEHRKELAERAWELAEAFVVAKPKKKKKQKAGSD